MNGSLAIRLFAVSAVLAAWIVAPGSAVRAADGVDAVLRASGAALGIGALPKMHTLRLHGTVDLVGVKGTGDAWQDLRDGTYAQFADAGPVGGAQGYDGTRVWNMDPSGYVWDDGSTGARYGALDQAYLNRYLLWMPNHGGATVAPGGAKAEKGKRYDVVRVTPKGSLPFDVWFDATSHLPVRTVTTIGTSTTINTFADYRSVRGLRVPFRQSTDNDGNASTFVTTRADVDDPGAAAALRRPAAHVTDFALPSGTTTIPFELVDNHVDLPVTINGKGPFRFLFDTGGSNIIDADVAKQLGLGAAGNAAGGGVGATTEAIQFATVDALGVGDATLRKQVFAVAPVHAGFGMSSGKPVDGLIGFEVLARFVTTFDYGSNNVVLRAQGAAPATGTTVPFAFDGQHPMIDCTIGGFAGSCVLDTGSRVALTALSPFIAAHPSVVPANATAVGANGFGIGGAALGRLGRTTLQIAGFTLPDLITDLSTSTKGAFADPFIAGNIGAGALKRFAVTFDYAHRTVTFAPNASFAARETYDRSGTFLITQGGKIIVADVRPGTPAADAGLARGDVLATVGGTDAKSLGLGQIRDAFRAAPGTAVPLGVTAKDGTARTVTLTLRDYI
ncbi:MAG TPA: aspartyl protease family protein [Candidatus Elarobacter sp.]|nr:aspartyl protease family protein [Candidatus Elarobacter sp.]